MITLKEIVKDAVPTEEQSSNIIVLLERINKIRAVYGKPMVVTSGLRDMKNHLRIYREKGITDKSKIPMKSKHLIGQAVDILDDKGELMEWCKLNQTILEAVGLWCEEGTVGWVHFQTVPPKSGRRFFNP